MRRTGGAAARTNAIAIPRRHRPLVVRRLRRARRQAREALLALAILVRGVLGLVPLHWAIAAAGAVTAAVAPWVGRPWRLADKHLARAFPALAPAERAQIARAAFANLGRSFAELMKYGAIDAALERYVDIDGLEHLRVALAGGKGVLAITGHIGNWELLAAYCARVGLPVNVIGRRLHRCSTGCW